MARYKKELYSLPERGWEGTDGQFISTKLGASNKRNNMCLAALISPPGIPAGDWDVWWQEWLDLCSPRAHVAGCWGLAIVLPNLSVFCSTRGGVSRSNTQQQTWMTPPGSSTHKDSCFTWRFIPVALISVCKHLFPSTGAAHSTSQGCFAECNRL